MLYFMPKLIEVNLMLQFLQFEPDLAFKVPNPVFNNSMCVNFDINEDKSCLFQQFVYRF